MFANIFHVCKLMTFPSAVKSVMNFQRKGINNNENTYTPANNRSFFRKFPGNVSIQTKTQVFPRDYQFSQTEL